MPFRRKLWFLALVLVSIPGMLEAGEVKGRVEHTGPRLTEQWVPVQKNREVCGTWRPLERLLLSPEGGVANVIVELQGVEGKDPGPPSRMAVLDNRDCRFMPRVQVARLGTVLEIRNSDAILHTAHAYRTRGETLFHVALPHFREQVQVPLEKPGLLRVICDVGHIWMRAYILVTDNPFSAVTDSRGRFTVSRVPAGTYRLRVWHELLGVITRPVTVQDRGTAVVVLRYP